MPGLRSGGGVMATITPRVGYSRRPTIETLRRIGATQETHCLACRRCSALFSADPRDYFMMHPGQVFRCNRCDETLSLIRKPRSVSWPE